MSEHVALSALVRGAALSAAVLLAGCPKHVPAGERGVSDAYVDVRLGAPKVCVAALPQAGPVPVEQQAAWSQALEALRARDPQTAMAVLAEAGDHPSLRAAQAGTLLLLGEVGPAAKMQDALLQSWPDDACLLQTGAFLSHEAGDAEVALARATRAVTMAPGDANAALIHASLQADADPEAAMTEVQALLEAHPDDVGGHFLRMLLTLQKGDVAGALPDMQWAEAAGMDLTSPLVSAYLQVGRPGDVVHLFAKKGLPPLEGIEGVAAAEDPMAVYRAWLGVGEGEDLVAVVHTGQGDLTCTLFPDKAPLTVANFVGLARGTLPWTDAEGQAQTKPLYPGTVFHRVVPGFMVQGGDPKGDGTGGPGYAFPNEVSTALRFDQPGRLAMANAGPDTNGSQFFVTEAPVPHLDGRFTIFGQCDDASVEVVKAIARLPTDDDDAPVDPVVIQSIDVRAEKP